MNKRQFLGGSAALAAAGLGAGYLSLRGMGGMEEYDASVAVARAVLKQVPATKDLIRYATLAANSHNTQPWLFKISDGGIEILPDMARRIAIVDPDNHHLYASLGCAAENLAIACGARGRSGQLRFNPANDGSVMFAFGSGPPAEPVLFDAIPKRQSTRGEYDGRGVSGPDLRALSAAAAVPGIDFILISDRQQMDLIRDLVIAGNSAQLGEAAFVRELKQWLRFSPRHAIETGDGLFSVSSGSPALPDWLGPLLFDLTFNADTENEKYARQLASSTGIAVFVSQRNDPEHWVLAGRACQRFALQATALGLKYAFINQPVEVASLRPELAALVGVPGRRPDIVVRFGYGPAMAYSARRPVEGSIIT